MLQTPEGEFKNEQFGDTGNNGHKTRTKTKTNKEHTSKTDKEKSVNLASSQVGWILYLINKTHDNPEVTIMNGQSRDAFGKRFRKKPTEQETHNTENKYIYQ